MTSVPKSGPDRQPDPRSPFQAARGLLLAEPAQPCTRDDTWRGYEQDNDDHEPPRNSFFVPAIHVEIPSLAKLGAAVRMSLFWAQVVSLIRLEIGDRRCCVHTARRSPGDAPLLQLIVRPWPVPGLQVANVYFHVCSAVEVGHDPVGDPQWDIRHSFGPGYLGVSCV